MPPAATMTDLREKLRQAVTALSARKRRIVTYDEVAKMLGINGRVDLYFAARGIKSGFGPKSERRRRVEEFITKMLKEEEA